MSAALLTAVLEFYSQTHIETQIHTFFAVSSDKKLRFAEKAYFKTQGL